MPSPKQTDKVIVTHMAALGAKYTPAGMTALTAALKKLIAADLNRGLDTVVIDLASAADAKKYKFKAVPLATVRNAKLHKQAIDKIYAALERPAYLMLLGAIDVIPHVPLKNPLFGRDDPDATADSDLPYACDTAYGVDPRKFIAPSRVVGRLPDINGGKDAAYLVGLIDTAAGYTERPAAKYNAYFGLSAKVWAKSTQTSLTAVFGQAAALQQSPPVLFPAPAPNGLGALAHFINCHGADSSPQFYGQAVDDGPTPAALDAGQLTGKVTEGTVVAAECCFGAQLYDPAVALVPAGICNAYLKEKAYGFFGSSTIAYGPAAGNDLADLVCGYFLKHVREGSSLGRAALQARLDYVQSLNGVVTACALKTLAQFSLLGDPALTPVRAAAPPATVKAVSTKAVTKGVAGGVAAALTQAVVDRLTRNNRRAWLQSYATALTSIASCVTDAVVDHALGAVAKGMKAPAKTSADDLGVGQQLRKLAEEMGLKSPAVLVFGMQRAAQSGAAPKGAKAIAKAVPRGIAAPTPDRVHVVMERVAPKADEPEKFVRIRGFEAVESNGALQVRKFVSR